MSLPLILATKNKGKTDELKLLLQNLDFNIKSLHDLNTEIEIVEDKDTFEGNAIKKAEALCEITGSPALSDDSGLCVDALDGRPGVYSARYGKDNFTDKDRCLYLLEELKDVPDFKRTAHFQCALAFKIPSSECTIFKGTVYGKISMAPVGSKGFGYDPVFIPDGYDVSMAELGMDIKNKISHRAVALNKFYKWVKENYVELNKQVKR
ncbi:MAG: RdgB/HAM1 family non-canonical purine NTP pyrophosphatase [Deltaproteobacteria bacterium]|nr:RdgB/HAM1 family non-canonical purine NTP pyrophosphatase [Deltaproteobacteria bacterium]